MGVVDERHCVLVSVVARACVGSRMAHGHDPWYNG